jgi:biopolymer transport protein ExbB
MSEVITLLKKEAYEASLKLCDEQKTAAVVTVVRAGLNEVGKGIYHIQQCMEEATLQTIPRLKARTGWLAIIALTISLTGLMGTVWGIMASLAAAGKPEAVGAKTLIFALNLSQSLFPFFISLLLSVFFLLLYYGYRTVAEKIVFQINEYSVQVFNHMAEKASKVHKFHIAASQLKEGVGLHVSPNNIKVFSDNKLIKEVVI